MTPSDFCISSVPNDKLAIRSCEIIDLLGEWVSATQKTKPTYKAWLVEERGRILSHHHAHRQVAEKKEESSKEKDDHRHPVLAIKPLPPHPEVTILHSASFCCPCCFCIYNKKTCNYKWKKPCHSQVSLYTASIIIKQKLKMRAIIFGAAALKVSPARL